MFAVMQVETFAFKKYKHETTRRKYYVMATYSKGSNSHTLLLERWVKYLFKTCRNAEYIKSDIYKMWTFFYSLRLQMPKI